MGMSIADYRAALKQQGMQVATGPCAGSRMSAAEYQSRVANNTLVPTQQASPAPAPKPRPVATNDSTEAPAAVRRNAQPEFDSQCALFEWARNPAVLNLYPALKLMSCSLNGVKLTRSQAGKAKAAGMLAGESDVRLPVARGRWIGLIIEMKAGRNKATQDQLDYGAAMEEEGHQFHVCYSWEDAKELTEQYLRLPRPSILAPK